MPLQVIDHNYAPWLAKKRQENGAATYSRDIADLIIPELDIHLTVMHPDRNVLVSTAPLLDQVPKDDIQLESVDLVIQFLHTYPYKDWIRPIQKLEESFPGVQILLITAYQNYHYRLREYSEDRNVTSRFLSMAIRDSDLLRGFREMNGFKRVRKQKKIIYFGNLYKAKAPEFHRLRKGLEAAGWQLDVISKSQFNRTGPKLSQVKIWEILSQYAYGIGVGRCALEMYALGMRVLISGQEWGGVCVSYEDFQIQTETNFNGRIITGTRDLEEALFLLKGSYNPHIHQVFMRDGHAKELTSTVDVLFYKQD